MTQILILIAMTLGLGVLDRYIGWGGHGRVKPVLASVAFLAGIGYLLGWPILAWATLPIAFLIWRTPGWKTLGGSLDPRTPNELIGTFYRHMMAVAFIVPLYYAGIIVTGDSKFDLFVALGAIVGFASFATLYGNLLAKAYDETPPRDINRFIEFIRGVTLGVWLSLIMLLV